MIDLLRKSINKLFGDSSGSSVTEISSELIDVARKHKNLGTVLEAMVYTLAYLAAHSKKIEAKDEEVIKLFSENFEAMYYSAKKFQDRIKEKA